MFKSFRPAVALVSMMAQAGVAAAYESGPRALGSAVGATDYYRMICPATSGEAPDGLAFRLTDASPLAPDAPRLEVRAAKGAAATATATIAPGRTQELLLAGGNGKYRVTVAGSSPNLVDKQRYTLQFQCLNANGQPTRSAPGGLSGKVGAKGKKTYSVKCASDRTTGATEKLSVRVGNTTKTPEVLMAQVVTGHMAINTTEGNEALVGTTGGTNLEYYVTIETAGMDPGRNAAKQYSFTAKCGGSAGRGGIEPIVELLQDQ